MIDKKYFQYLFVAIMAMGMSLVMSFSMTWLNIGFSQPFFMVWMSAFILSFFVAFPTALVMTPVAKWSAKKLTRTLKNRKFK